MCPLYLMNPSLRNLFMKKLTRGPGRADNLRQCLLTDLRTDRLGLPSLPKFASSKSSPPRKSPLTRIKQLVNQILLNPTVAGEEISHKQLGKFRLIMNSRDHRGFRDRRDDAISIAVVVEMRNG